MALLIVLSYAALVGFVYLVQDSLLYYPHIGREISVTPVARGLRYEEISIVTSDGETLHAWWVPTTEQLGAVALFHGNAGNISHRIEYASMFYALGYSTLLVDYRGYGKSTGRPSEEGTYRDADAAWLWLTQKGGIEGRDIVLFGESLGGGVAAWLAARYRPRALVLASTFTSALDLGAELYRFLPVRLISRFSYDTLQRLAEVKAPVLVIHSPADDIIPFAHGQRLYAAANEPKAFLELRGGHNDGLVHMRPEWVEGIGEFLARARRESELRK